MAEELFPGYDAAVATVRPQAEQSALLPAPTSGGGDMSTMLMQALMAPSPMQEQQQAEGPPKWMYFIPGFAKGVAMRKQMDAQDQALKLQKQQLAGQQAQQKLQQIQLMQKIENQQKMKRWAGLYGGLIKNEDVLDPQAKRELEGELVTGLAEAGDPDAVQKFIDARMTQRELEQVRQMEAQNAGESSAPAPVAVQPSAPPAAPTQPMTPPSRGAAVYERMARDYATKVGVDPDLAVAVMRQESSSNPAAVGDGGQAVGLFQLHPAAAQDVGLDPARRGDPQANIRAGVDYLKLKLQQAGGDPRKALELYNGGGTPGYAQRVQARMPVAEAAGKEQLELAQLRNRADVLEANLRGYAKFSTASKGPVKARIDSAQEELKRTRDQIKRLEDRSTAKSSNAYEVAANQLFQTPYGQLKDPAQIAAANQLAQDIQAQPQLRGAQIQAQAQERAAGIQARAQERAAELQAQGQVRAAEIHAQQAYETAVATPLKGEERLRFNTMTQSEKVVNALATEFTPEERAQYVGAMGLKVKGRKLEQALKEVMGNPTDPKFGRFAALLSLAQAETFSTGGKSLTDTEKAVTFGYIPSGEEWSAADFEQKLALAQERIPQLIDTELEIANTPTKELAKKRQEKKGAGFTPSPSSGTGGFKILGITERQ